jgi:SOS-response transcriptional repressor LexA
MEFFSPGKRWIDQAHSNVSRGIELIEQSTNNDENEIPLLGIVAAGQPIEAFSATIR